MKKGLVLIPTLFLLSACSGGGENASLPDISISVRDHVIADITLNISVKGIDEYSGQHSTIWISSPYIGVNEDLSWAIDTMEQSSSDQNKWSYVFHDYELLDELQYKLYYGDEFAPKWRHGQSIMDNDAEYYRIETKTTKKSYDATAKFQAPDGTLDVSLILDPIIYDEHREVVPLMENVKVWAWNDAVDDVTLFEKRVVDEKEVWVGDFSIDTFAGSGDIEFTPVLGSSNQYDFAKYQHGRFNAGVWKTLPSQISGKLNESTLVSRFQPLFNAQPDVDVIEGARVELLPHILNEEKESVDMLDTTYVYAWHDNTADESENTDKYIKQEDESWLSPTYNVEALDGVALLKFTPTLGISSEPGWKFKHGEYVGDEWVELDSVELYCTDEDPLFIFEPMFNDQPKEETFEVTFKVVPSVKVLEDEEWVDQELKETSYVYAWISEVSGDKSMFTKNEDGSFEFKFNVTTWIKVKYFQFTLILNHNPFDTSDGEWGWKYKSGTILEDGSWQKDEGTSRAWSNEVSIDSPVFTFEALFNGQPS